MKVKYTGTADVQEFGAADFSKANVEGKKTSFPRGKAVEVSDEVGALLTGKDDPIFGDYSFEEVNDDGDDSSEREAGSEPGAGSDEAGADDEGVTPATGDSGGTSGPSSTGRGTSTAKKAASSRSTGGSTP